MGSLIWKDIIVQKRSWWTVVFYAVFMHIALAKMVTGAYTASAFGIAYLLVLGASAYDEKNKGDMLLNSLPLPRKTIVLAKYVGAFVFMLVGMLGSVLAGTAMKLAGLPMPLRFITGVDLLGMFVGLSFFIAIYFPIFFKFGYMKSRYLNIFIFMLLFFGPQFLVEQVRKFPGFAENMAGWIQGVSVAPTTILTLLTFIFAGVVLVVSFLTSVAIYQRREMI